MFTGLIRDIGEVVSVDNPTGDSLTAKIKTKLDAKDLSLGASVSCSGVCLTVVALEGDVFTVQASAETLNKTRLGTWTIGTKINLEPSLRLNDELGGHLVFGHVDGLAEVIDISPVGDSFFVLMEPPIDLHKYMAVKGSVTLDGVSLTVNEVGEARFALTIIPHTWTHTTFGTAKAGDRMHIEIDMIARYTERLLGSRGLL
mgnify:CR=1 FL=1